MSTVIASCNAWETYYVPKRVDTLEEVPMGDEFILYDESSGKVHVLNKVATHIRGLADGTRSVGQIVDAIVETYAVDEATAEKDVKEILGKLSILNLIRLVV